MVRDKNDSARLRMTFLQLSLSEREKSFDIRVQLDFIISYNVRN
jgi:hypothetical protein